MQNERQKIRGKHSLYRIIIRSAIFIYLAFITSFPSNGSAEEPVTSDKRKSIIQGKLDPVVLQLKWFHQFQFAGYYAAVEKGFYQEAGLEVTLRERNPEKENIEEVLSGNASYGAGGASEILLGRLQGKPLVVLAAIFQHSPSILLARRDSGIFSPQDIVGHKAMLGGGRIEYAEALMMCLNEGVSMDKIKELGPSFDIKDLIDRKVDVVACYETNWPYLLKQRGISFNIIYPRTYGIDFYGDCLYTTKQEIAEHPERVKALLEATLRGWEYAMSHPDEIIELIQTKYEVQIKREVLHYEAETMAKLILPDLVEIGHMNPGRWEHMADTYAKLEMIDPEYSLEGFIYNPKPDYTWIRRAIGITVSLTLLLLAASITLLVFNRRLKKAVQQRTSDLSRINEELVHEISECNLLEEALRESEEKYRELFEMESDAIFLIENQTGRILEVNAAGLAFYGYSREELLQMKNTEVSAEPDSTRMATITQRSRIPVRFHHKKDGTVFPVEITARHFTWRGREVHVAAIRDITERLEAQEENRKIEAQFQQAQKMESLGTLAGGIAHDFNNLLMGIQGNASLMLLDIDSMHSHYEKLKNIEQYVQNGADLTKQLLGFARGGKYEVKPTALNELIKHQNRMFGRAKKEITIHGKYEDNLWTVEVDQGQIEQVLLNLYVNAWQAMPGGGELYIQTENVIIDKNYTKPFNIEPGRYVKISVTDTGIGMDEETQQRIFDPFFTTKDLGRGTGLGLASVYGIIKNHAGIINFHSEKGKGTTFTIYLPASEMEAVKKKELPEEILKGKEAVLLVDDEEMIIDVGKQMMEKLGYNVLIARSGKEAIEVYKANREKIDIAILDMVMPDMSGGDTYDIMKEINPDIKVLLSSGYSINGQATEILDRGCNGFIQKPFDIKQLSRKIRSILDKV